MSVYFYFFPTLESFTVQTFLTDILLPTNNIVIFPDSDSRKTKGRATIRFPMNTEKLNVPSNLQAPPTSLLGYN